MMCGSVRPHLKTFTCIMPPSRRPQRAVAQLADLVLVQLTNWRWAWRGLVITGMITPVATMVTLSAFSSHETPSQGDHVLAGALVLALLFQNLNHVAGNFAFMKATGTLDFFAAQPVSRVLLAIGTVCAFFLISIPALI